MKSIRIWRACLFLLCRSPLEVGKWRTMRSWWFWGPAKAMHTSNTLVGMIYSSSTAPSSLMFLVGRSGYSSLLKVLGRDSFRAHQGRYSSSPHRLGTLSLCLKLRGRWSRGGCHVGIGSVSLDFHDVFNVAELGLQKQNLWSSAWIKLCLRNCYRFWTVGLSDLRGRVRVKLVKVNAMYMGNRSWTLLIVPV